MTRGWPTTTTSLRRRGSRSKRSWWKWWSSGRESKLTQYVNKTISERDTFLDKFTFPLLKAAVLAMGGELDVRSDVEVVEEAVERMVIGDLQQQGVHPGSSGGKGSGGGGRSPSGGMKRTRGGLIYFFIIFFSYPIFPFIALCPNKNLHHNDMILEKFDKFNIRLFTF